MQRCVVVTGAASGIGRATAEGFLKLDDRVVLSDVNGDKLEEAARELSSKYGEQNVAFMEADIANPKSVDKLAAYVQEKFGVCDVLANCAGVFRGGPVHLVPDEDYNFQFDINVRGSFNTIRAFAPGMLSKGKGAIANISSASGVRGDYNAPVYCASKAAIIGLTQATALDYAGDGVRVNCVSPSATETPMFLTGTSEAVMNSFLNALPDHKLGKPENIADAIVFLCSDAACHITGQNLPVDGGLTAWNGQPRQNKEEG